MNAEKQRYSDKLAVAANQNPDERDYWLAQLSGEPVKTHFPYDFDITPANLERDTVMNSEAFRLSGELFAKTIKISGGIDLKLHMILAAGLMVLLARYTAHPDIMIGSPILKQETIEEFVNTLLIFRNRVEPHRTFKQLLLDVRETIVNATDNQNYPMVVLYDKLNLPVSGGESPLIDVVLFLESLHDKSYIRELYRGMTFSFRATQDSITGEIEYDTRRYRPGTIQRISRHFTRVLDVVLTDVNVPLAGIDLLSAEEKRQLLVEFNRDRPGPLGTDPLAAQEPTLHQAFERQVMAAPDRLALVYGHQQVTYRELNEKANQLAYFLKQKGAAADTIVGLRVPPSIEMMLGQLGIMKSGAAYLPIALDTPPQRMRFILEDSNAKVLLTNDTLAEEINNPNARRAIKSFDQTFTKVWPPAGPPAASLAYIIYTSGTTGQPRGVMVEHRQVMAYLRAFYREFTVYPQDTVLQLAPYSFDVFIEEVYPLLLIGGKVLILQENELMDLRQFSRLIPRHGVTIIDCTPLLLNEFNRLSPGILEGVRLFISGGDLLKKEHITQLSRQGTLYNTYGPTETTVCATYYRYSAETGDSIPIGKPIAGYRVYILDEADMLQPIGVTGQVCIAGAGVSRGYLNNPELTHEKFVSIFNRSYKSYRTYISKNKNHTSHSPIYHSGDLARWLPDGNIEFLGRTDQQVKIRGFRIELAEIEKQLLKHDDIKESVVIARTDKEGDKYLCAYIVTGKQLDIPGLREYLARVLPYYMLPAHFVLLEKIPLTPHGKTDRRALPAPRQKTGKGYTAPRSEIEKQLAALWTEILGGDRQQPVGLDDDFFELGGHSLKATILTARVHQTLRVELAPADIFQHPTIREIAGIVTAAAEKEYKDLEQLEKKEFYELSYNQERLLAIHRLEPESPAFNLMGNIEIKQPVEETVIKKILQTAAKRHESLRASFKLVQKEPVLIIAEEIDIPFRIVDLSTLPEPGKQQKRREIMREESRKPFKLFHPPLFRTLLLKLQDHRWDFIFNMHHIITDGWSLEILKRDIFRLYQESMNPQSAAVGPLDPLPLQYKDFAAWHNTQLADPLVREGSQHFWKEKLKHGIEVPELPVTFGGRRENKQGAAYRCVIPAETKEKLNRLARETKGTLFTVMFSFYLLLLSRLAGQTGIACAIISAGRKHSSLHQIVGFFINSILFNTRVDFEETFVSFLDRVNREVQETVQHETYPLELVFKELKMKYPEIPVSFNMLNLGETGGEAELQSAAPDHMENINDVKFHLEPYVSEYKNGIHMTWTYQRSLFKPSFIEHMVGEYLKIMDFFLAGQEKKLGLYVQKEKKRHFSRGKSS